MAHYYTRPNNSHILKKIKRPGISIPIVFNRWYQGYLFFLFGNFKNLKMPVEKTENQDEIVFSIALINNRVTSQNFYNNQFSSLFMEVK